MLISERLAHKRPVFSFEFFPPKTEKGEAVLWTSLQRLAPLGPDFVSVTYGAGGSTRDKTLELVGRIKAELGLEPVAHLTCVGSTRDEIARIADRLGELGVRNILALRGDPPRGAEKFEVTKGGFAYATELVAFLRERTDFCIGAACYPEVHPEASDAAADLRYLKQKVDAGADYLVTQLFFDNRYFREFSESARAAGIDVPILPGIMPVSSRAQIKRFTSMCGATIPGPLDRRLAQVEGDAIETFWTGVTYAAAQCRDLLEPVAQDHVQRVFGPRRLGAPGIHFYTLNKSPATRAIFEILRVGRFGS